MRLTTEKGAVLNVKARDVERVGSAFTRGLALVVLKDGTRYEVRGRPRDIARLVNEEKTHGETA
jgi:hypothetical protein